jgi:hypothetical protein
MKSTRQRNLGAAAVGLGELLGCGVAVIVAGQRAGLVEHVRATAPHSRQCVADGFLYGTASHRLTEVDLLQESVQGSPVVGAVR